MEFSYNPLEQLDSQELVRTPNGLSVTVSKEVPDTDHEALWNMISEGFIDLNRKSYESQDMTYDEFVADLESPNVLKYVARDETARPVGLLTVHVGFDDITWTDTSRLRETQEQTDLFATSYYVGTLVVPPSERGTEAAPYLVKASFLHFQQVKAATGRDSLVFFDCAHANYPWLGRFVQGIGSPDEEFPDIRTSVTELYEETWAKDQQTGEVYKAAEVPEDHEVLDKQHYYSISFDTSVD